MTKSNCRAVVAENDEVTAINHRVFIDYLTAHPVEPSGDWRHRGAIRILLSVVSASKRLESDIPAGLIEMVSKNKGILKKRTPILDCIIGGYFLIRENQQVSSGIANGTVATLVDIVLSSDAHIRWQSMEGYGCGVHTVDAHYVVGIVLHHCPYSQWSTIQRFPALSEGCFPLKPKVSQPQSAIHYANQTYRIEVGGFECIPAYGLTCHKMQGMSVDGSLLLASFGTVNDDASNNRSSKTKRQKAQGLASRRKHGEDGWLYVVLSRVRRFHNLYLMEELDPNPANYKPRKDVIAELKRIDASLFQPSIRRIKGFMNESIAQPANHSIHQQSALPTSAASSSATASAAAATSYHKSDKDEKYPQ
jgi:hypothetical protein